MTTLLVTGAAGFIGSHFVRHWVHEHPADRVVALDALTYAGTETNLTEVRDAITFVHADIGDQPTVEDDPARRTASTWWSTSPPSRTTASPCSTPAGSSAPTCWAPRRCWRPTRQVGIARFHHVSTCEVYGDLPLDAEEAFTEETPYGRGRRTTPARQAPTTRCAPTTRPTTCRSRSPTAPTTTARTSSRRRCCRCSPRTPWTACRCRSTGPSTTAASGSTRCDHVRAIEAILDRGVVGETYHVGTGVEASVEQMAEPRAGRAGPARVAQAGGRRPPRPRPPLPAGLHEDPARTGLGAGRSSSTTACATRSAGTPTTATGGSRCATAARSSRAPGRAHRDTQRMTFRCVC